MYAKVANGSVVQFPYSFNDLRSDNPDVSFPRVTDISAFAGFGVVPVAQQPNPAFNAATHKLVQGVPVLSGSDWVVTRVVTALTAQELKQVSLAEDAATLKADSQVINLLTARPAAINNYIETNVTNLAQAKDVLKILARAIAVVASNTLN
jgi:hypothetical protein